VSELEDSAIAIGDWLVLFYEELIDCCAYLFYSRIISQTLLNRGYL
jgi:hypothetical protein